MARSGTALGGAWLLGLLQACDTAGSEAARAFTAYAPLETFDAREGADFEAFSALIIPTDHEPGAREAGTVYFADRALGSFFQHLAPPVRDGLADLARRARAADSSVEGFADLSEERQLDIMRVVERDEGAFFGLARLLVVVGFACNPEYGGNRNRVGWQVLGFQNEFRHEPPFGAYDRNEHGGAA